MERAWWEQVPVWDETDSSIPQQLADAWGRVQRAKADYEILLQSLNEFLHWYVGSMVRLDADGEVSVQLHHPHESWVRGQPAILVTQIVDSLRSALDYITTELSVLNNNQADERKPQFIIAKDVNAYRDGLKHGFQYLTTEQQQFFEALQPYRGNEMLGILSNLSVRGKHRRLPPLLNLSDFELCLTNRNGRAIKSFKGYFAHPVRNDIIAYVKFTSGFVFGLDWEFDTLPLLKSMISHIESIVRASANFFQGVPVHEVQVPEHIVPSRRLSDSQDKHGSRVNIQNLILPPY